MNNYQEVEYLVDMHVHTARYSPCAELLVPELLDECMQAKGVHGVVITEHNVMWEREEIDEFPLGITTVKFSATDGIGNEDFTHCGG